MRYGPFVFLGLLAALSFSWLGMIATPQLQLGRAQPTNVPPANVIYPAAPSGLAAAGRDVYRANGCAYCHTQIVRQDGVRFDVLITSAGTNESAVIQAVRAERPDLAESDVRQRVQSSSASIKIFESKAAADAFQKVLTTAGAEVNFRVVPAGPDIQRAWGTRMTVAQDYLYQMPLMLGSTRLGPDLSNVGMRQPDPVWHLVHLYDPKLRVDQSIMPRYPFLFEKRKRGHAPSPAALPIPGDEEIIPTREGQALAAYLLSLRADMPLFEAPGPRPPTAAPSGATNQPALAGATNNAAASGTNSAATNQAAPR